MTDRFDWLDIGHLLRTNSYLTTHQPQKEMQGRQAAVSLFCAAALCSTACNLSWTELQWPAARVIEDKLYERQNCIGVIVLT